MSNFLQRLGERAAGTPSVRPRVSWFEPGAPQGPGGAAPARGGQDEIETVHEEVEAAREPGPRDPGGDEPREPGDDEPRQRPGQPPERHDTGEPRRDRPRSARSRDRVREPEPEPRRDEPGRDADQTPVAHRPRGPRTRRDEPLVPSRPAASPRPADAVASEPPAVRASERAAAAAAPPPAVRTPSRPAPAAPPPLPAVRIPQPAAVRRAQPQPEQPIHVTIGRLEVRAALEQRERSDERSAAAARGPLALDEYLRRRSGGRA